MSVIMQTKCVVGGGVVVRLVARPHVGLMY